MSKEHLVLLQERQLERRFKEKFPSLGYLWPQPKARKLRETFASQGGVIQRRQLGEIIAEMLDGVEPVYRADPEEWL